MFYHRTGLYAQTLPFIPGVEGAGVVEDVGPGVTRLVLITGSSFRMSVVPDPSPGRPGPSTVFIFKRPRGKPWCRRWPSNVLAGFWPDLTETAVAKFLNRFNRPLINVHHVRVKPAIQKRER